MQTEIKGLYHCPGCKGLFWEDLMASNNGYFTYCKPCANKKAKKYYRDNESQSLERTRNYRTAHPDRKRANDTALRRLTEHPCEVCEATPTHRHHDDYSEPLEIRWLCPTHHKEVHLVQTRQSRVEAQDTGSLS